MTLRHLKIFIMVCDAGSMTAAAKKLYITQPSVSQAISELESYYSTRLFERLGNRLYITETGKKLLSYARHVLNLMKQAKRELADLRRAGTLRLGASMTIGTCLLSNIVKSFLSKYPDVQIFTVIDNTKVIEEMLLSDQLDLALVEGPIHSADIVEEHFAEDELILICPPNHPWTEKGQIKMQELNNCSFIVREQGSGTREIFEMAMSAADIKWQISGIYNNAESIKNAVASSIGITVISKLAVKNEVASNQLAAIKINGLQFTRQFNIIYHKNKFFTTAMEEFKTSCLNNKAKLYSNESLTSV